MKKFVWILAVVAGAVIAPGSAFAQGPTIVFDNFQNLSQLAFYGPDRSEAKELGIGLVKGQRALKLTVGHDFGNPDPFYNFQGYIRWMDTAHAKTFGLAVPAYVSVRIFVPESWAGGTAVRGGDLWVRIDDPNYDAGSDPYPTAGFYNYGDGAGLAFSIFEGYSGAIVDYYDAPIKYGQWNEVMLAYDSTGVYYYCNNKLIHHDAVADYSICLSLEAAFLQGWRASGLEEDYDVVFDDLKVGTFSQNKKK